MTLRGPRRWCRCVCIHPSGRSVTVVTVSAIPGEFVNRDWKRTSVVFSFAISTNDYIFDSSDRVFSNSVTDRKTARVNYVDIYIIRS